MSFGSSSTNKYSLGNFAFAFDTNAPMKKAHALIGVKGWVNAPTTSGNQASAMSYIIGPYIGYMNDRLDIFVGPALGSASATVKNTDASPNNEIKLSQSTMGCGIAGIRYYFGNYIAGLGLVRHYCKSSNYTKVVTDTSQVKTTTTENESTTTSGAFLYLFAGFGDSKGLFY